MPCLSLRRIVIVSFQLGSRMSEKPPASAVRLLIGIMIGGSLALIGLAVWMIVQDEGSPVWVALGGSMLGAFAAIIASQSNKKS